MQRSQSRVQSQLPDIKTTITSSVPPVIPRSLSRFDQIEDRLHQQEKTTQSLLDRASKVKEDIIDNLNLTHGTWHEEKRARELLQEHIKSITDVVRRLDWDIKNLEEQLKSKETQVSGASNAVKNLEVHHITGLTDLRGRVARCDAGISRLASDIKGCYDTIKVMQQQQMDTNSKVIEKLSILESKLSEVSARVDKTSVESNMKIKHVEGDSNQQVLMLNTKTKAMVDELKTQQLSNYTVEASERDKMESRLSNAVDRLLTARDARVEKIERKFEDALQHMSRRVAKTEEDFHREKERSMHAHQVIEQKVTHTLDATLRQHNDQINKVKRECREGFITVHESIGNMKTVLDGKRKLLEEQIRKEIGQIRKMVVLV